MVNNLVHKMYNKHQLFKQTERRKVVFLAVDKQSAYN